MKNAYEQQHRKLSEFMDFVKDCFSYVEKMMSIISFLRNKQKFSDWPIKKLCMFKDVTMGNSIFMSSDSTSRLMRRFSHLKKLG